MRLCAQVVSLAVLALAACTDPNDPKTFGTLKVALQGSPKGGGNTDKVVVTLVKVTAHSESAGWVTLSTDKQTVDLLNLAAEGLPLGSSKVPAGKITQLRLYTAEGGPNYVQMKNGTRIELKVPSGVQSGIKVKGPFDVWNCQQTMASLQLDGNNSIHVHPTGQGDLWILRPVIKLAKTDFKDLSCPGDSETPNDASNEGSGGSCTNGAGCISGVCNDGVCGTSGPGGACASGADCASGSCGVDKTCAVGPNVGGAGSECSTDAQCASGYCMAGSCDQGGSGTPCTQSSDCGTGNVCEGGSCTAQIL